MMFMFPIEYFIGLILIGICAGFASGLLGIAPEQWIISLSLESDWAFLE